jgi:hypothetical protein
MYITNALGKLDIDEINIEEEHKAKQVRLSSVRKAIPFEHPYLLMPKFNRHHILQLLDVTISHPFVTCLMMLHC